MMALATSDQAFGSWAACLAAAREELQLQIYGRLPDLGALQIETAVTSREGRCEFHRWKMVLPGPTPTLAFEVLIVTPLERPSAIVVAQTFRHPGASADAWIGRIRGEHVAQGFRQRARESILGRHIHAPPFHDLLSAGIGLVLFCPADCVPDHPRLSAPVIDRLSRDEAASERGGVLAHWAALTSAIRARTAKLFENVPMVAWGHSRHGKSALLAAAFDPGFAGVIAHQSGRFGASLTEGARGESVAQILRTYPHWFCRRLSEAKSGARSWVDQHHLLALIAPRPLLLGNARGDFWADPAGAIRAAQAASSAYVAMGGAGLLENQNIQRDSSGGISVFERPGWHGVNDEDWRQFLAFLDIQFGRRGPSVSGAQS